jgi:hypothetical protein
MMAAGLWTSRRALRARVDQPRYRRDCLGELIQIDGCEHWWFEDRGPQCSLLVFIDDARSRLMQLQMVPTESAFAYMQATRAYYRDARQAGGVLLRQAQCVSGQHRQRPAR